MPLLLLAVLVIYFLETNQLNRKVFVYPAFALLVLAFFASGKLVLAGVFVAWAVVLVLFSIPKKSPFVMGAGILCILLMFLMSGEWGNASGVITREENLYGIEQEKIDVMNEVLLEAGETSVIAPKQLAPYLSAYSERLTSAYTYPEAGDVEKLSGMEKELYQQMQKNNPDAKYLTDLARDMGCGCIILDTGYHYPETPLSSFGFEKQKSIGVYDIYKDVR